MHILATTSASLDDLAEPVDLGQTPAEMVALSFTDSDLAGLAAAWQARPAQLPEHAARRAARSAPSDVGRSVGRQGRRAMPRSILVRILGGYDWWRYGCDRLAAVARERGIELALLPGECRERDERLVDASTLPARRAGGAARPISARAGRRTCARWLRRLAGHAGRDGRRLPRPSRCRKVGLLPASTRHRRLRTQLPRPRRIAGRADPVLPLDAACRRRRADRRAGRGARRSTASRRCRSSCPA